MGEICKKPVWQMTGQELCELISDVIDQKIGIREEQKVPSKTYVHGIRGIAELFGCSIATANQIKRSGIIDDAISQINRTIVVDADLAFKLLNDKKGGKGYGKK